jgi:predicted nucleotidyltransferase
METPSEHLRATARRIVDLVARRVPLRAALLAGSAGRGDADHYSDIDLLLYVDAIPPANVCQEPCEVLGGIRRAQQRERSDDVLKDEFELQGIRVEIAFATVRWMDARLDDLLDRLIDFDTPSQKVLMGLLEGLPLHGAELLGRWKTRAAAFPEPLRKAMVERYWKFFPLWYAGPALEKRDAALWRLDALLEATFNLLGVLAALNRMYFTRFQFKHLRRYVSQMSVSPPRLAERVESLFRLDPGRATVELESLIEETAVLVRTEMPDLELHLAFPLRSRQSPWRERPA